MRNRFKEMQITIETTVPDRLFHGIIKVKYFLNFYKVSMNENENTH